MPIPYRLNPMGKNEKKYFELVVKPGILAADMTYGFTPYWNSGGYCKVDWGDGQKREAGASGIKLNHTYAVAGTYTIKIKAECYQVRCASPLLCDCSENWDELGSMTGGTSSLNMSFDTASNLTHVFKTLPSELCYASYMFRDCGKADFVMSELPDSLTNGESMFHGCTTAQLPLTKLPEGLTHGMNMFQFCYNAQLPLTKLPEGLTNGMNMFYGCSKAQFTLTKLPDGLTNGRSIFQDCKNAEMNLDTLAANAPAEGWTKLTNITNMFYGCTKVTGSRSAFLAKCPNVTSTTNAFAGTNTTE